MLRRYITTNDPLKTDVIKLRYMAVPELGDQSYDDVLAFANFIGSVPHLRRFVMIGYRLSHYKWLHIIHALRYHTELECVDIRKNGFVSDFIGGLPCKETIHNILLTMPCMKNVRVLKLSEMRFSKAWSDDYDVGYVHGTSVKRLLQENTKLRLVKLNKCHFDCESFSDIMEGIEKNQSIVCISISSVLRMMNVNVPRLHKAIGNNPTIECVRGGGVSPTSQLAIKLIRDKIRNQMLRKVDILMNSDCGLPPEMLDGIKRWLVIPVEFRLLH